MLGKYVCVFARVIEFFLRCLVFKTEKDIKLNGSLIESNQPEREEEGTSVPD